MRERAPRYEQVKNLRCTVDEEKKRAVFLFYKNILPCVCGKKNWKNRFRNETVSQATTVNQEALALWILHNYEGKWLGVGSHKEEHALYTGFSKGNKMFTGWDNEGIQKYNEFCNFVRQNRNDAPCYELELREEMKQEYEEEVLSKQMESDELPIQCFDDLDGKLQNLPRTAYNCGPPQTTVVCNMQQGINEVASTISASSASTSYKSADYNSRTFDGNMTNLESVAI